MIRDRRALIWTMISVLAVALILNKVDDLFGREVGLLVWLYAAAAVVDLVILGLYLHQRRRRRVWPLSAHLPLRRYGRPARASGAAFADSEHRCIAVGEGRTAPH